ncbi:MAG: AEC family transporter [Hungatella sp.]
MEAVLTKAIAFVAIIILGYVLKKVGLFRAKDFYLISVIVMKITLPAAIVSNFSKITLDFSLLILCVIGFGCNWLMIGIGYLWNLRRSGAEKAFAMLNLSGYNIGNFTMPFVQSFLSPIGFAATSLFDAGNAIMCTGMTYTVAGMAVGEGEKPSLSSIAKKLFSSVPFDAYIVMTILAILKIRLPAVALSFADTAGSANAFLALLMLGIGFEVHMDSQKIAIIIKTLSMRFGTALLLALGFYWFAPFTQEIRQTLAIISLGPVASLAPAFTGLVGGDVETASAINSLSIVISIFAITSALLLLL